MVFGPFKKIVSLVLSGILVKPKFLWFINILQKLQKIAKSCPWVMIFQYSLIVNILVIDECLTLIFDT